MSKIEKALSIKGCQPVTLYTRTKANLTGGKSCPYQGAIKLSIVNGMVGGYYQNAVNNALERMGADPDFVPGPRKWGNRVPGTPFVEHRGKRYVEIHVKNTTVVRYEKDGEVIDRKDIEPYLRKSSSPVKWRDPAIESIVAAKVNGEFVSSS